MSVLAMRCCATCHRPGRRLVDLFVNDRGWLSVCSSCSNVLGGGVSAKHFLLPVIGGLPR